MASASDPLDSGGSQEFLAELVTRLRFTDILLLAVPPAVLIAVFQLPQPVRAALVFDPAEPTLLTAFAAHFAHLDAAHLSGNLAVYALVLPVVYLLLLISDRLDDFRIVVPSILLAFPIVLSALSLLLLRRGTLVGFSGLAMGFVGVLPVALFRFIEVRVPRSIDTDDAPVLFFTGAAVIALRVGPTRIGATIAAAAGLVAALYVVRLARRIGSLSRAQIGRSLRLTGYVELTLATPILFVLAILTAFPADPQQGGGAFVDLLTHLFGYALGFIASYLTIRIDRTIAEGGLQDR